LKKEKLAENIIHYSLPLNADREFGINVTAIFDGNKVLLIDTGYESDMELLLQDFAENSIEVEGVIISHFHDDHMEGLKLLPGVKSYGSGRFQETLDRWIPEKEHKHYTPSNTIDQDTTIKFGNHIITMIPFPDGHSPCSILTIIDDEFIHMADDIMRSVDGRWMLPCLDEGKKQIPCQVKALHNLKEYSTSYIIPGHGSVFGQEKLTDAVYNLTTYLNAITENDGDISFEEATKNCNCSFACTEWHKDLCR